MKQGKIPPWAKKSIRAAIRRDTGRAAPQFFDDVFNRKEWSSPRLFDHYGTSRIERLGYEGASLVTEPYGSRAHIESAFRFADWIGCEVEIGGAAWWYPGWTVRIEFYPKAAEQDASSKA